MRRLVLLQRLRAAGRARREHRGAVSGRIRQTALLALALLGLVASPSAAATRYDPLLRFRTLATPHFAIHYHQGEETQALRLSLIVEAVYAELTARMEHAPRGRTHVVLVDQDDDPNGWTTPVPYNLIEITAAPPTGSSTIGNTSDWLRMVFTHEYAHVLHLEQSRGWATLARGIFGRTPFAFPNLTLPLWQIEGIATFEESHGGEGRVYAGDFHEIVRRAARSGTFEPLDRVSGGLVDWPSGSGWYAYGAYFHDYLARRFGEAKLAELSRRTAGRFPYFGSTAFKKVYGASLGSLWRDFSREEATAAPATGDAAPPVRLTHHGFLVGGPRFDSNGTILYSRQDAHEFPSLNRVATTGGATHRVATRYGGGGIGLADGLVYFDQLEVRHQVALSGDVYRLDLRTGAVRRLTRGARLTEVDLSPDHTRIAAVHIAGGERRLVVLTRDQLDSGRIDLAALEKPAGKAVQVAFASPRWSPDGRSIAAERRLRDGPSEIVLVDPDTHAVRVVATSPAGRNITPAWTPDGRTLLFASDRAGGPFDLYRLALDGGPAGGAADRPERLTALPGGASAPDVSPDGRTIVFVGYTIAGYDLFTVRVPDERAAGTTLGADAAAAHPRVGRASAIPSMEPPARAIPTSSPYHPWSTLVPRAWLPVVETSDHETRVGAAVGGADALGYHGWAATVTWSVARDADVEPVSPGSRPDVQLAYAYDRWRPTFYTQYHDETTPLLVGGGGAPRRPVAIRAQSVDAGAVVPFRRIRWSESALAAWRREHDVVSGPSDLGTFDRAALRGGWVITTARQYGYSVSPEDGVTAGGSVEIQRRAFGGDGDAEFYRGDARAFVPAWPRHGVLALRASGVVSRGDAIVRRTLRLGGHDPDSGVLSFDEDASSLLRGFPTAAFLGTHVVLANAEYRVPLTYVQRGVGTWPLFLRAAHASVFLDAGQAWTDVLRASDLKFSWGGEVAADAIAGYGLPFTWVAGVGWGRDRSGAFPDNREAYFRIGRGF